MSNPDLLALAQAVERIAFEMPAMNPYTPRLVQLCVEARRVAIDALEAAQSQPVYVSVNQCKHAWIRVLINQGTCTVEATGKTCTLCGTFEPDIQQPVGVPAGWLKEHQSSAGVIHTFTENKDHVEQWARQDVVLKPVYFAPPLPVPPVDEKEQEICTSCQTPRACQYNGCAAIAADAAAGKVELPVVAQPVGMNAGLLMADLHHIRAIARSDGDIAKIVAVVDYRLSAIAVAPAMELQVVAWRWKNKKTNRLGVQMKAPSRTATWLQDFESEPLIRLSDAQAAIAARSPS